MQNRRSTKTILLCGCFSFDSADYGGQPVKSRELYWAFQKMYGIDNVHYVETKNWRKHPIKLLICFFENALKHDYILMMPAKNGLKVFSRLLYIVHLLFNKKIYYSVIGGWLPEVLRKDEKLKKILLKFDGIWIETTSMKESLDNMGFKNITVVPNFKSLKPVKKIKEDFTLPLPLCTFSRVMEEKGIEDAICAVENVNKKYDKVIYALDIYGQIDDSYKEKFEKLKKSFPSYIRYQGVIPADQSVSTVMEYYALLFPTHFYTEGIPGTLIDALFAGVPVLTALWCNSEDIFKEGVTGWGYEFGKTEMLEKLLLEAYRRQEEFTAMRKKCVEEAVNYQPTTIVKQLDNLME